jgi:hypothetical protein
MIDLRHEFGPPGLTTLPVSARHYTEDLLDHGDHLFRSMLAIFFPVANGGNADKHLTTKRRDGRSALAGEARIKLPQKMLAWRQMTMS